MHDTPAAAETDTGAACAIKADLGGRAGVSLRRQGGADATGHRPSQR